MKKTISLAILGAMFAFSLPAQAKGLPVYFGESDELNKIEGTTPIKMDREQFSLGYRTYFKWFVAGVYVKDEGYVLIDHSDNAYVPLDEEDIKQLQEEKTLPTPLPQYSLSAVDYLKGYSLWLIIIALAGYFGFKAKRRSKSQAEGKTETTSTEAIDK